jgi:polyisoprenyl-phosphate glycosyltransferase
MSAPYLSVVCPCYNEQDCLSEFHRRAGAACRSTGRTYEIVLVNDGSTDQTWPAMLALADADPCCLCVNLSRNHGHQLALTAGLTLCRGERVLIIDADLQDPPELLAEMLKVMDAGADVVYGQRRRRAGETAFKRASAAFFYRLLDQLTDTPIPRDSGDFRLLSRRALDVLLSMPERHRFLRGMVSWIGFRQEPLPYERDPRHAGRTKYPLRKMLQFAADAVTGFSIKPLAFASLAGVGTSLFAFALFVYSLVSWLGGGTVHGWTSLMAGMALLSSIQLLVLGIIGAYVGRLFEQSKGRPLFVIERVYRAQTTKESPGGKETS